MDNVKCEVCSRIAKTIYIREIRKVKNQIAHNIGEYKIKFVAVGYFCPKCLAVKMNNEFYIRRRDAFEFMKREKDFARIIEHATHTTLNDNERHEHTRHFHFRGVQGMGSLGSFGILGQL